MASMSITLNPDASSFISSRRNTVPSATPLTCLVQNPNPYLSYYPYPFYFQKHQTQHGTSVSADLPPQYSYQYLSFPRYYTTFLLVAPPCGPALPPAVPRCSIEEQDGSLGTEKFGADEEMVQPKPTAATLVVSCRRTRAPNSEQTVTRARRGQEPRRRSSVKVRHSKYEIREDADFEMGGKTTLMIKNIPGKFSKGKLIAVLRDHCIEENRKARASEGDEAVLSEFDYFYLPIDFRTNSNFGYAFVNFTSPIGAWRLVKYLNNHRWISAGSSKVCQLNFARIQGLVESIEHADQMTFSPGVPDMFLPVHFQPPYNGLNEPVEYVHGMKM